jgi:hypothetical protein
VVQWDLGDRPAHRQEVVTHPCVNLVFEPHGAAATCASWPGAAGASA